MGVIRLGTRLPSDLFHSASAPRLFFQGERLRSHAGTPWLADWLRERHGIDLGSGEADPLRPLTVEASDLDKHAVLVGASGSGKTRLALHLLREQLYEGCSAVVIDVKADTVLQAVRCGVDAGLGGEDIALLWPQEAQGGMPEWNPLAADDVPGAVAEFVDAMRGVFGDAWGHRMEDLLRNAATVVAAQRLSLAELVELLRDPAYRAGLLANAERTGAWDRHPHAHDYFEREYGRLAASGQREAAGPVLNKVRAFAANRWLRALICAPGDTLDLPGLWRRPRLAAVYLDRRELGEDGVALLAGLLVRRLYGTALRRPGPVPVVLFLDELDTHERIVGSALLDILRRARQQGLRLIAATQTLSSVSHALVTELLGNTWLRAFFALGPDDARRIAGSLADGQGTQLRRLQLSEAKEEGLPVDETACYPVTDERGRRLALSAPAWSAALRRPSAHATVLSLLRMSGMQGWVKDMPLERCQQAAADAWNSYGGPDPLTLRVRFPRPDVRVLGSQSQAETASALASLLQSLPSRRAVMRLRDGTTALVQATRMELGGLPDPADWLRRGQPPGRPEKVARQRERAIAALTAAEARAPAAEPPRSAPERKPAPPARQPEPEAARPSQPPPAETRRSGTRREEAPRQTVQHPLVAVKQEGKMPGAKPAEPAPEPEAPARVVPPKPEVADDGSM